LDIEGVSEVCRREERSSGPAFARFCQIAVVSRLERDEWQTDDGQTRSKLYLVADEIEFLDKPSKDAEPEREPVAEAS
jgi:hypothetical protein